MKIGTVNAVDILSEEIQGWFELAVKSLPNIVAAFLIMAIFIVVAKLVRKSSERFAPSLSDNEAATQLLATSSYIFIILVGIFVSLGILKLDKTVTSLLAGAGVIGLALGFAFQEIASNFVSGVFIAFRRPYKLGDIVDIDGFNGQVTNISLRTSSITTFQGLEVLVPNKYMFTKPFTNFTTTPKRRLDIDVGVSYGDDLTRVEEIVKHALENINGRLRSEPIEVYFTEFGSSSINFQTRIWIEYPGDKNFAKARHQSIIAIKEAFDKNKISIPFPIRTLDFGIKGGESIRASLKEAIEHSPHSN